MHFMRLCLGLVAALALAGVARAVDVGGSPMLLVANPAMSEFYSHTVLFARPIGGGSHLGFIVNRPTRITMSQAFPDHAASKQLVEPIFLGGPVHTDAVYAVVQRAESPGGRSIAIAEDMFLVIDAPTVDQLIEQNRANTRFYAGLVVWGPGELENELRRGFWYVMDHDARLLFRKPTDGLYEELVGRSRRML